MKRVAWYTAVILATLAGLILVWQFRISIVLFLLSLGLSAAFRPLIDKLIARNLPRYLALFFAYILVLSIVGIFIFVIGGHLLVDLQRAIENLAEWYEITKVGWSMTGTVYQRTLADQIPPLEDLYESLTGEQGVAFAQGLIGVASGFFELIGSIVIVLILSMYWSADHVRFERLLLSLVRGSYRGRARDTWRSIEAGLGSYLRDEGIKSLATGLILWLGFMGMGLELPALLAVFGAFVRLIPWLGPLLALIPPSLIGLNENTFLGILAGVFTVLVLVMLERLINPRDVRHPKYSSLLLVLVVIAFAQEFGLVGLILAPPSAAAIQIIIDRLVRIPSSQEYPDDFYEDFAKINDRFGAVRVAIDDHSMELPPETRNLVERLEDLVEKTNSLIQEEAQP